MAKRNLPEEFFGLKFGEKYTVEQMKAAVGERGNYFVIDNSALDSTYTAIKNELSEAYDMSVILSNERSQSKGSDYRRYVTLNYIQTEINRKIGRLFVDR